MHRSLLEFLQHIQQETKVQERICVNTRHLFKPWPKQGEKQKESNEGPEKVEEKKSTKVEPTSAEEQELNLLQELLAKAEKAREVQRKVDARKRGKRVSRNAPHENKNRSQISAEACENVNSKADLAAECEHEIRAEKCSEKAIGCSFKSKENTPVLRNTVKDNIPLSACKAPGVIKQTDLNRLLSQTDRSSAHIPKRSKQASVFLNAPFKTDPNVRVPKKRPSPPAPTKKEVTSGSSTRTSSTGRSAKLSAGSSKSAYRQQGSHEQSKRKNVTLGMSAKMSVGRSNKPCEGRLKASSVLSESQILSSLHFRGDGENPHTVSENGPFLNDNVNNAHPVEDDRAQENECVTTASECEQISEENFDFTINDITKKIDRLKIQKAAEKKDTVVVQEERPLNLLHDGKKLTIPVKLRKIYTENLKLKNKLQKESLTKKMNEEDTCVQFVEKLESQFEVPEAVSQQNKIQEITNIYHNLLSLIGDLNLNDTTDDMSIQHLLKARKYLEFILNSFYNMEKVFMELSTNTGKNKNSSVDEHMTVLKPKDLARPSIFWLPNFISGSTCTVLPQRIRHLQYCSGKELKNYYCKVFHLQYLLVQKWLMECSSIELVPLLENVNRNTNEFITVFQSVYSLLCGGKLFPVIIKDTISDRGESLDGSVT